MVAAHMHPDRDQGLELRLFGGWANTLPTEPLTRARVRFVMGDD